MRKDIVTENLMNGGVKVNKSALARQYGCCWETIDRRLNTEKYQLQEFFFIKRRKKNLNFQISIIINM